MNKILIVQDEEKISNVQKAYLEKEGYEVYTSTTGLKALELFDSIEFNLVILDLMLPDIQGEEISLTPNEFDILYALAVNKGKVLTREQLIDRVFGMDFEGFDRTVDVHIKNIRKKIEEDSKNPKYILTVTRLGYKFGGES